MFQRLFITHPASVGEGYFEHLRSSLGTAGKLARASAACVVHAIVPGLCKTTGSTAIMELHSKIYPRRFDQPTL
jgi:hypothetical protein